MRDAHNTHTHTRQACPFPHIMRFAVVVLDREREDIVITPTVHSGTGSSAFHIENSKNYNIAILFVFFSKFIKKQILFISIYFNFDFCIKTTKSD